MSHNPTRRRFVKSVAAIGIGAPAILPPHLLAGPRIPRLNRKRISVACIGMGGQMQNYLVPEMGKIDLPIVAICDVDQRQIDSALKIEQLANAKTYHDYRALLANESGVDAVVIGTPDHWHVPICKAALEAGKHVYCEKPLAHSIAECHELEKLALAHPQLATQTGNQGCSTEGFRRSYEVIQSGVLGDITEVHVWHPAHGWPNGVDRPTESDPIPADFDWDFWLGAAPMRPYKNDIYHPQKWRGWYDFGGGSLADFCCHAFQLAFRSLELAAPTRIEATGDDLGHDSFPTRCNITFEFAAGKINEKVRAPVKIIFYSGDNNLPPEKTTGLLGSTGCVFVGTHGSLSAGLWNTDCNVRLSGEEKFRGADHPAIVDIPKTQPRIDTEVLKWDPRLTAKGQRPRWSRVNNSHMFEWALACTGEVKTYSPFEIGARITEIGLLGVLALRMQQPINWDAENRLASGLPEADPIIDPPQREFAASAYVAGDNERVQMMNQRVGDQQLSYLIQSPTGQRPAEGWPLLLFLHGYGECGTHIEHVKKHGPPKLTEKFQKLADCIIVSPQCPRDSWWRVDTLKALVDEIMDGRNDVDRRRIYVTGLSMGGYGIWSFISKYPNYFAAAVPICGGGDPFALPANRPGQKKGIKNEFDAEGLKLANKLPVWTFHGSQDSSVPIVETKKLVQSLKDVGSKIQFTEYPDAGHVQAWEKAYDDQELWNWLFEQRKATAENPSD